MHENSNSYYFGTYKKRYGIEFSRANGCYLYDAEGNRYLDFASGDGENVLDYNSKIVENAVIEQIHRGFYSQQSDFFFYKTEELARKLVKLSSFPDAKVLFSNTSSEANENAVQIARKRYNTLCEREYSEIIVFSGSSYGKTMSSNKLQNGFVLAKYNDIKSVENLITEHTSAIMLELVQVENGLVYADFDFVKKLRELCNYHKVCLIFDETSTAVGKTGSFFAYENYNVKPDIVSISAGLGAGFPISACICNNDCYNFVKNDKLSTFTGNAVCSAVAKDVVEVVADNEFLRNVDKNSTLFVEKLRQLKSHYQHAIEEVKYFGMLVAIKLYDNIETSQLAEVLIATGLISLPVKNNTICFLPPLIVNENHILEACEKISQAIDEFDIINRY